MTPNTLVRLALGIVFSVGAGLAAVGLVRAWYGWRDWVTLERGVHP